MHVLVLHLATLFRFFAAIMVDFTNNSTVIIEDGGVVAVNVTVSGGVSHFPITLLLTATSRTATNGELV